MGRQQGFPPRNQVGGSEEGEGTEPHGERKAFFYYGEVWSTVRRVDRITQGFCATPDGVQESRPCSRIGDQQLFVGLEREIGAISVDMPVTLGRLLVFATPG